jgi:hypothetical protein
MDDCNVTAALERTSSLAARLLRSFDPDGYWRLSWFAIHQHDMVQHLITNFSAELWGWDEEFFHIELDRDLWFFEDDDGPELPDFSQHLRSRFRDLRGQENPLLGYDSGDGI